MPTKQETIPTITCRATLYTIGPWTILRLPQEASKKLPSRGQVMVEGTFNGVDFWTPLEPDGKFSHWFRVSDTLLKTSGATADDTIPLTITPLKTWPEPTIPADFQEALNTHPEAHDLWQRITPMARWEWIRWTRATNQSETRKRRIEVGMSKLTAGERRPCCWNRNASTEPRVSKNGVLLGPTS